VIALWDATVLPGFIDAYTYLTLTQLVMHLSRALVDAGQVWSIAGFSGRYPTQLAMASRQARGETLEAPAYGA
jgi:hypothetical protein